MGTHPKPLDPRLGSVVLVKVIGIVLDNGLVEPMRRRGRADGLWRESRRGGKFLSAGRMAGLLETLREAAELIEEDDRGRAAAAAAAAETEVIE